LQLLQLDDQLGREQIAAGRRDLPELDERGAEVLDDEANARLPRDRLALGVALFRGRSEVAQAHPAERLAEPVPGEDGNDLTQATEVANRSE
jgi:hypothetical protein